MYCSLETRMIFRPSSLVSAVGPPCPGMVTALDARLWKILAGTGGFCNWNHQTKPTFWIYYINGFGFTRSRWVHEGAWKLLGRGCFWQRIRQLSLRGVWPRFPHQAVLKDWSSKNDASMGFDQERVDFMELDQHREWNQPYNEIS